MSNLVEGKDYYLEDGMFVFTSEYLLQRGYCCNSGCRHCPYPPGPPSLIEENSPINKKS